MALFLDRHDVHEATAADIAAAHELDLAVQDRYQVRYLTYWFDDAAGTVFCLAEGPDRGAVEAVHRDAHGLMADNLIEVGQGPINAFLGEIPRFEPGHAYTESAFRAILFTDLCDSTRLTNELGDVGFMSLLHDHDDIVRAALTKHGGREVKHTGDGIMASFASVSGAIEAAIGIQRRMMERNLAEATPMSLRIGVSAGEPVTERDDLFGAAVQLSARLCDIAPPGGIAVSTAVRELCVGKPFDFDCRGEVSLKGFAQPVSVFEVRLPDG